MTLKLEAWLSRYLLKGKRYSHGSNRSYKGLPVDWDAFRRQIDEIKQQKEQSQ